jgi:hypothetical protein
MITEYQLFAVNLLSIFHITKTLTEQYCKHGEPRDEAMIFSSHILNTLHIQYKEVCS